MRQLLHYLHLQDSVIYTFKAVVDSLVRWFASPTRRISMRAESTRSFGKHHADRAPVISTSTKTALDLNMGGNYVAGIRSSIRLKAKRPNHGDRLSDCYRYDPARIKVKPDNLSGDHKPEA